MRLFRLSLLLLLCALAGAEKTAYQVLGVSKSATDREIRKAYRKASLQHHPDKSSAKDAVQRFAEVAEAYEQIQDAEKRRQYDSRSSGNSWGGWGFNWQQQQQHRQKTNDPFIGDPLVVRLGAKTWEKKVGQSTVPWVVYFYTQHCHFCHRQSQEWRRLAELVAEDDRYDVEIGAVNCASQQDLCTRMGARIEHRPIMQVIIPVVDAAPPPFVSSDATRMLTWASFELESGAGRQLEQLRTVLDEGADDRATVYTLNGTTFTQAVFGSAHLWVVAYVAMGNVGWSPMSPYLEASLRRLATHDYCEGSGSATVRFGLVNCETDGALCADAGIGMPFGFNEGDMPQLVAYPAGRRKAGSYKLMPGHLHRVHRYEVVDRVQHLAPALQAALGCAPDWAQAAGLDGEAGAAYQPTMWKRQVEMGTGKEYWSRGGGHSQWEKPEGWESGGGDLQTLRRPPPPPPPPPPNYRAHAHSEL